MSTLEADASQETTLDAHGLSWRWRVRYEDWFVEASANGLMAAHWAESGTFRDILRLNFRHDYYQAMEAAGRLDILVVRDHAEMVGYAILMAQPYSRDRNATMGTIDILYARPDYRGKGLTAGLGWQITKAAVQRLKDQGITLAMFREKPGYDGHLKRLGFEIVGVTYGMVLNPPVHS